MLSVSLLCNTAGIGIEWETAIFTHFFKFRAIIAYNLGKYFQWFLNTIEYYPKYKYAL